jgi:hypothetical protein
MNRGRSPFIIPLPGSASSKFRLIRFNFPALRNGQNFSSIFVTNGNPCLSYIVHAFKQLIRPEDVFKVSAEQNVSFLEIGKGKPRPAYEFPFLNRDQMPFPSPTWIALQSQHWSHRHVTPQHEIRNVMIHLGWNKIIYSRPFGGFFWSHFPSRRTDGWSLLLGTFYVLEITQERCRCFRGHIRTWISFIFVSFKFRIILLRNFEHAAWLPVVYNFGDEPSLYLDPAHRTLIEVGEFEPLVEAL